MVMMNNIQLGRETLPYLEKINRSYEYSAERLLGKVRLEGWIESWKINEENNEKPLS